jgi:hypothetical protein
MINPNVGISGSGVIYVKDVATLLESKEAKKQIEACRRFFDSRREHGKILGKGR